MAELFDMKELEERVILIAVSTDDEDDTRASLDELEELADMISNTALCGLGKSAAKPVVSTLRAFRSEYEAHIVDKTCPSHVCTSLRTFHIDPDKCIDCGTCAGQCPTGAISAE